MGGHPRRRQVCIRAVGPSLRHECLKAEQNTESLAAAQRCAIQAGGAGVPTVKNFTANFMEQSLHPLEKRGDGRLRGWWPPKDQ